MDRLETITHHALIAQHLCRDLDKACEFTLEEITGFLIEREDAIFDAIEIALDCSDRGTDLMREIREKVRSDLFLDRERLMEIVNCLDEWVEFVFLRIAYTSESLSSDDTFEILDDRLDREEYRAYPEIVDREDEDEPDEVDNEKISEDTRDEDSLWCIVPK